MQSPFGDSVQFCQALMRSASCSAKRKPRYRDHDHPENGGALETAAHESPRTTKLYDRTADNITLEEIERIRY